MRKLNDANSPTNTSTPASCGVRWNTKSEIAEELGGITRQSVVYSIKKGEQRLFELEEKLGFAKRLRTLSGELEQAKALVKGLRDDYSDERLSMLEGILSEVQQGL